MTHPAHQQDQRSNMKDVYRGENFTQGWWIMHYNEEHDMMTQNYNYWPCRGESFNYEI